MVCHHVAYNAQDLGTFARRLTEHARHRVVLELTAEHPQARLSPLWLQFHGVVRPTGPTADDAEAVPSRGRHTAGPARLERAPAGRIPALPGARPWDRRQLCLPADRDPEVLEAISPWLIKTDGGYGFPDRPVVTMWWEGAA